MLVRSGDTKPFFQPSRILKSFFGLDGLKDTSLAFCLWLTEKYEFGWIRFVIMFTNMLMFALMLGLQHGSYKSSIPFLAFEDTSLAFA